MKKIAASLYTILLAVSLLSVVGCGSTSKQEGAGEYIDDAVITTKVKAAIIHEPGLKIAEFNVQTFKGEVLLSGFVKSLGVENKAVEVARKVEGVKSVKNDIRIK